MNDRQVRGYAIISKGDRIEKVREGWLVPSQSADKKYLVENRNYCWVCECPDNQSRGIDCKHIHAVKFYLGVKEKVIEQEENPELIRKQKYAVFCPYCHSDNFVKCGKRKNKTIPKQKYLCRACKKYFVAENEFKRIKGTAKIVTSAMDLYFKGLSLRKIQQHLKQIYGFEVSYVSLSRWIKKFMKLINNYTDKMQPKAVSEAWHSDEQMIKSKGKWIWCWNVIDEATRFLLANNVTEGRFEEDARAVLKKAKETAGTNPEFVITDGLQAYREGVKKEFYTLKGMKTEHLRASSFRKGAITNNLIERYHGTFRERDKVMRGFKSMPTAQETIASFRTYYNFVKPHQSLNGLTPAQVCGIGIPSQNVWLELIKLANAK